MDELGALSVTLEDSDADTDADEAGARRARHAGAQIRRLAADTTPQGAVR